VTGFDELRAFCWHRDHPLPIYGSPACLNEIKRIFQWAFLPSNTYRGYVKPQAVETHGPFSIGKLVITPIMVEHGNIDTQGYRFDYPGIPSIAYLPDVKVIPESSIPLLEGIGVLIIDALRQRDHPTHMNIQEAISCAKALNAGKIYLTHLSHELDVPQTLSELPKGFDFAYDGLKLNFSADEQGN
jgi:phosphoribosyl 1,2-cyclic phosphate phosphodiesterase